MNPVSPGGFGHIYNDNVEDEASDQENNVKEELVLGSLQWEVRNIMGNIALTHLCPTFGLVVLYFDHFDSGFLRFGFSLWKVSRLWLL